MKLVTLRLKDDSIRSGWLEGSVVRLRPPNGQDAALAAIHGPWIEPSETISLGDATLLAPPRIFGVGLNYVEHAAESKMKVQNVPTVFMKLKESITGPDTDVLLPPEAVTLIMRRSLAWSLGAQDTASPRQTGRTTFSAIRSSTM